MHPLGGGTWPPAILAGASEIVAMRAAISREHIRHVAELLARLEITDKDCVQPEATRESSRSGGTYTRNLGTWTTA